MYRAFILALCLIAPAPLAMAAEQPVTAAEPKYEQWWAGFGDPLVPVLAVRLKRDNLSIRQYAARIDEARARVRSLAARRLPDVGLGVSSYGGNDLNGVQDNQSYLRGGLSLNWELDILGRIGKEIRASDVAVKVTEADRDQVTSLVMAELLREVVAWRQARKESQIVAQQLKIYGELVVLAQARVKAGLEDETRFRGFKRQAETLAAQAPLIRARSEAAVFSMQRLLDMDTDSIKDLIRPYEGQDLPALASAEALPLDRVVQRPDVRAAQGVVLGSKIDVAVAKAARYPKLTLQAFVGVQDSSEGLRVAENPLSSLVAQLTQPVFNASRIGADIKASKARQAQNQLAYKAAVGVALAETQTAYRDFAEARKSQEALQSAVNEAGKTQAQVQNRFDKGLADGLSLAGARLEQQAALSGLNAQKTQTYLAYIRLQQALGPN
jgi:outer membrane protein TolC